METIPAAIPPHCATGAAFLSSRAIDAEPCGVVAKLKRVMGWRRLWPRSLRRRWQTRAAGQPATLEEFEAVAQAIWDGLPGHFREALGNVAVAVANFADAETLAAMGIGDRYDLLGLYEGTGLPSKSVWDAAQLPDRIFLYRIPIMDYARRNGQRLDRVIRHVLIHEIGHHFGFSDADMARIEAGA
jgi:predicted Zn-dependent protease with MMP-like domain